MYLVYSCVRECPAEVLGLYSTMAEALRRRTVLEDEGDRFYSITIVELPSDADCSVTLPFTERKDD